MLKNNLVIITPSESIYKVFSANNYNYFEIVTDKIILFIYTHQ